ncbi:MAG: helix-turn-helix domain-containing protein [Candidatus Binataceae bacterium]
MNEDRHTPLLANYLTASELCAELHISPRTLERWLVKRNGPPRTRLGGRVLFSRTDVAQWLRERSEAAPKRCGRQRRRA